MGNNCLYLDGISVCGESVTGSLELYDNHLKSSTDHSFKTSLLIYPTPDNVAVGG